MSLSRNSLSDATAAGILSLAKSDGLAVGEPVPSHTELADRLGVSRSVVSDAIDKLAEAGAIERGRRRRWVLREVQRAAARSVEEVQLPSLVDQATDALLAMIVGDLREGDALPPTSDLADRFGVSVAVVREAQASLAARGILRRRQGRESEVAVPGSDLLASILSVRAHLDGIDTDEFQTCRASLEAGAAQLAASAGDCAEKRAAFEPSLDGMRAARNAREFNEHDLAFHMTLAELSGNRAIVVVLETLNGVVRRTLDVTYRRVMRREGRAGVEAAIRHHEAVASAVVDGDPGAAVLALHDHFRHASR